MANNLRNKRFGNKRRGVAGVIAGVFFMAIILSTVAIYFVLTLTNERARASYQIQSEQENQAKAAEVLAVVREEVLNCVPGPDCFITVHLTNDGSPPLVLTNVLLYCTDTGCPNPAVGDNNDPVEQLPIDPLTLDPIPLTLNAKEELIRTVGPVDDNLTYRVDAITERGNIVSAILCLVDVDDGVCIDTGGAAGPDFEIHAAPSTLVMVEGSTSTSNITVTSLNGFAGAIDFNVLSPPEITATALPDPINLLAGSSAVSILTITTSPTIPEGTYILTVTGQSGPLSHPTQIAVSTVKIGGAVTEGIIQGTGSLQLDFKSFGSLYPNWGTRDGVDQTGWNVKSGNATGYPGHSIPKHDRVVMVERMRNFDLSTEALTIASQTGLSVTLGKAQANSPTIIYICKATPPVTPNTEGVFAAYDDSQSLPYTPLTAGRYDNFRDMFFCSQDGQRKLFFWNPAIDAKFEGINGIFMVARGFFGAKSDFYAQTIPYQSILITNTVNACLKTVSASNGLTCPAFNTDQPSSVDFKYFADVAEMQGPLAVKMRLETTNHAPYNVEWVYPSSGRHVTLTQPGGENPVTGHIQFNLPTTMEDGVTAIQPGFYTIIVASDYYEITSGQNRDTFQQDIHYMTFRVT